jgi:hypothetical protein
MIHNSAYNPQIKTLSIFKTFQKNFVLPPLSIITKCTGNFCIEILFCNHYFSPDQHFHENKEESLSGSVLVIDGSGRPKNIRILRIRNHATNKLKITTLIPTSEGTCAKRWGIWIKIFVYAFDL